MGRGKEKAKKEKKLAREAAAAVEALECPNSLSSNNVRQRHLALDLDVSFEKRVFSGSVELTFEVLRDCESLTLDTRDLFVASVTRKCRLLPFRIKREEVPFGRALEVVLDKTVKRGKTFSLRVEYETSPTALGLQWLDPSLTEGKKHPYVFSQFQAIHARSFVPCQDTPMFKGERKKKRGLIFSTLWSATYEATIRVPSALTALMSAIGNGKRELANGRTEYYFSQKINVATYLIAVVVGNLQGRVVGPISTVWAEPEVLERAAYEFAEVNEFIKHADAVTDYPYRKLGWGKYDILVLPKSFPYGGMENPLLTFVTPTLLTGDRSATSTIIHELAHSWFGNSITCRTWESFWMNEVRAIVFFPLFFVMLCSKGFTCWLERKIWGRIHGEAHRDLAVIYEDGHFRDSLKQFSGTPAALSLVLDLTCTDPDDFYGSIAYEKGSQLLYWLEKAIVQNSPLTFESCIQVWIKKHVHGNVTSEEFEHFFEDYYANDPDVLPRLAQIPWHAWFHDRDPRGCPVDVLKYCDASLVKAATDLAKSGTRIWFCSSFAHSCSQFGSTPRALRESRSRTWRRLTRSRDSCSCTRWRERLTQTRFVESTNCIIFRPFSIPRCALRG
jgi:aminopeptidase N